MRSRPRREARVLEKSDLDRCDMTEAEELAIIRLILRFPDAKAPNQQDINREAFDSISFKASSIPLTLGIYTQLGPNPALTSNLRPPPWPASP